MMRLVHLPANQAWTFTFGNDLCPMGDTRFFDSRADAVAAAEAHGLTVSAAGEVHAA